MSDTLNLLERSYRAFAEILLTYEPRDMEQLLKIQELNSDLYKYLTKDAPTNFYPVIAKLKERYPNAEFIYEESLNGNFLYTDDADLPKRSQFLQDVEYLYLTNIGTKEEYDAKELKITYDLKPFNAFAENINFVADQVVIGKSNSPREE